MKAENEVVRVESALRQFTDNTKAELDRYHAEFDRQKAESDRNKAQLQRSEVLQRSEAELLRKQIEASPLEHIANVLDRLAGAPAARLPLRDLSVVQRIAPYLKNEFEQKAIALVKYALAIRDLALIEPVSETEAELRERESRIERENQERLRLGLRRVKGS